MNPRVVYWNNIPAPYMVERFNAVADRANIVLEVWFTDRTESDRSWNVDEELWRFSYRYVNGRHLGATRFLAARLIRGEAPDVFVSLYAAPAYIVGSRIAAWRGARTAFWTEVTFDAWVSRRRWKEALKSALLPSADAILTAGDDGARFAARYGAARDRTFVVPHVIDFELYARRLEHAPRSRDDVHNELGVRGVTFIYVGRLWAGKGLDYLLNAFFALQRTSPTQVSLLIVGDGVEEARLRARCAREGAENVIFAGFHDSDSLPALYAASDVFVFPTLGDPFGMVVLEAMACGLPVISTSAAGEIRERIDEGVNGFVVPPADAEALRARMELLASDESLRARMGDAARAKVAGQSPAVWAEAFEEAVDKILSLPRIR
jgi:glycosyltransferase involved in cell wall biosynthesis